ncbi:MAG: T9SS type A sorting domain-containing protein [Bacteroidales bacterium]|nr:T9SS type A sorting domain-containing protein [Bacteroidales bacterium]
MNKLAILRRFTLSLVFVLAGVILWGQTKTDLAGSGTELDPYLIESDADWTEIFAIEANAAKYWASGIVTRLDKDITVSTMVGTSSNKYRGTFDGNWHTLTLAISSSADYAAPFSYINGASIKNLKIVGNVETSAKYAGSLVGSVNGNNTIMSCTSTATITISTDGDASTGGLAGRVWEGANALNFYNCSFEGSITGSNAEKCAGFVGWVAGTVGYTNCLMAGTISISKNTSTFNRQAPANASASTENAYYITNYNGLSGNTYPGPDGTIAPTSEPTTVIGKKYTKDETNYYVPGAALITGLETKSYSYTGNDIVITPSLTYYGWTMTENTDYEISYEKKNGDVWESVSVINAAGDYRIIISGTGNYAGSYTSSTIHVVSYNTWDAVKAILADDSEGDRNITLSADIYPENPSGENVALVVNGTVILNLNGHTIDRKLFSVSPKADPVVNGQVIRVNNGANLTINGGSGGNGTIKGGYNYAVEGGIDGGGIYNMGNLVLNNVKVIYNGCMKGAFGATSNTARGGGIYSGSGSSLIINGGEVSYNEARGGGGGVCGDGAHPFNMNNVHVYYNEGGSKGGGIRVENSGSNTASITSCNIYQNFVRDDGAHGGGVFFKGGNLNMEDTYIQFNGSRQYGSGFFAFSGTVTAKDCHIDYNSNVNEPNDDVTDNKGGGVCLWSSGSTFIMEGGTIQGNSCNNNGGAIYVYEGSYFKIKGNVQITDNNHVNFISGGRPDDNNAYLTGSSTIEVIGDITGSEIYITPLSGAKTYVTFAEGVTGGAEALSHFKIDGSNHNVIIDNDGNIEVYEPYLWTNTTTWNGTIAENSSGASVPTSESSLKLHRSVRIPSGISAQAGSISTDPYCDIIIDDGAQLFTNNTGVSVVAKKNVEAADEDDQTGWYLISSPVSNPSIEDNTNLITKLYNYYTTYDLYRYNEAADLQWENYRASHADFTTLENGRGYLYRNSKDHTIDIGGTLNVSDITYTLSCNGSELTGFNLIGNPYSHTIYKGAASSAIPNGGLLEEKYYTLSQNGEWVLTNDGTAIAPMTGVLVQAREPGTLTMKNSTEGLVTPSRKSDGKNIWFTVAGGNYEDRACVEFKEGRGLNKIAHQNEDAPMLYINHKGEDFASVDMNPEAKAFGLYFKAKTTGYYTLSVQPQGEFGYLHLIDKLTGSDVDMLKEEEYTFIGSAADKAERFVVRLSPSTSTGSETFAYQSGDDIIVEGEGELQVFDVMGRLMMKKNVNGLETIEKPSQTGVYIFRLDGQTQKIVVR